MEDKDWEKEFDRLCNLEYDDGGWIDYDYAVPEERVKDFIRKVEAAAYEGGKKSWDARSVIESVAELQRISREQGRAEGAREERLAFGGCTKCYGKGYNTQMLQEEGYEDFGGEGYINFPKVRMNFCSCDRGKQLRDLLSDKGKEV